MDANKFFSIGTYRNTVKFDNKYDAGLIKDQPTGSTSRNVTVDITPTMTAPVMAQPQMATTSSGSVIPTIVNLSWSYPDANTAGYVSGYVIYMTQDPNNAAGWQRLYTTTTPITAVQVSNLHPNTMYYFRMQAYGNNISGAMSGVVSVKTPQVSPQPYTNSLGMSFKPIPAGTFMMGSPPDEPGASIIEQPQHQVTLTKSFYMQTTEVTQGQWKAVMGSNPSYFTSCGDNCPVEQVSWDDAQAFIQKLNQMESTTKYRLPTEAEWEYAARAGNTTAFGNGGITYPASSPVDPNLNLMGWYYGNSAVTYTPNYSGHGTRPVQGKQANAYGLFDMHGNVWEWVQDWYGTYPTGALTDPTGPSTGSSRVLRGGSWEGNAQYCRSASRDYNSPGGRGSVFGFRLVREQ